MYGHGGLTVFNNRQRWPIGVLLEACIRNFPQKHTRPIFFQSRKIFIGCGLTCVYVLLLSHNIQQITAMTGSPTAFVLLEASVRSIPHKHNYPVFLFIGGGITYVHKLQSVPDDMQQYTAMTGFPIAFVSCWRLAFATSTNAHIPEIVLFIGGGITFACI